jgi:long-chain acyl-CoA synthetase
VSAGLSSLLDAAASHHGDRVAIRDRGFSMTYAELDRATDAFAALLLERGVVAGDRVGIMLPNVLAFPLCYYAVLRLGAIVVPLNPQLKAREIGHVCRDAELRLLLAAPEPAVTVGADAAAAGVEVLPIDATGLRATLGEERAEVPSSQLTEDATAVIIYTSGTSGTPKGAELTHANLRRNAEAARDLFGLDAADVTLGALPLFHSFGQTCGLNATVAAGGCLSLLDRFDPGAALEQIERDRITVFEGVPTMYDALLGVPEARAAAATTLRICVSGGDSIPAKVLSGFEQRFGCAVLEGYGLSETSPIACFNRRDAEREIGSIGSPIPGVEMRLLDRQGGEPRVDEVGEILIRGHNVMKGYWRRPAETAAAIDAEGWFHSGDLARRDASGNFFIVGRAKELIVRGGYNVYPREVEELLREHPGVLDVAVLGIPHERHGEEVGAAVVPAAGAALDAGELRAWARERIAAYKYPRVVWFLEELPKGSTGKVLKREIPIPEVDAAVKGGTR